MPNPDAKPPPCNMENLNAIAGGLSYALVERYPNTMDIEEAREYAECGSEVPVTHDEVIVAFWLLTGYGLAEPVTDEQWRASLAAFKAEENRF